MENEKRSILGRICETVIDVSGVLAGLLGICVIIGFEKLFGINQKPE
jgi:hypothetical protein